MTPHIPTTPAGRLVATFGDPERMCLLYAPCIEWSLPRSIASLPRPMVGLEAVKAFNRFAWEQHYFPDCEVEIVDETGDLNRSAVRFIYRARLRTTGLHYENEYTLFARSGPQGIEAVFESPDTLGLFETQRQGGQIGDTYRRLCAAQANPSST
jgi:hypothetical protein